MSRRRYISTAISLDKTVNRLAQNAGDFAALLYTWMIPHAEDNAQITGDLEELLYMVVPGRRDKTVDDIEAALLHMSSLGLVAWNRAEAIVYFDTDSFYRYQAYIPAAKRSDNSEHFAWIGDNNKKAPKLAQKAASLSPSPSPSTPLFTEESVNASFDAFWNAYPRKINKKKSRVAWKHLTKQQRDDATRIAVLMARAVDAGHAPELGFVPIATTFIHGERWHDWDEGAPDNWRGDESAPEKPACPTCGAFLTFVDGAEHCPVCVP